MSIPIKFKVRIRHYEEQYYKVEYCNYRFFPIWKSLLYWFSQGHLSGTEGWNDVLLEVKEAEKVAKSLSCMNDVKEYHKTDESKAKAWYIEEVKYIQKKVPYKVKYL